MADDLFRSVVERLVALPFSIHLSFSLFLPLCLAIYPYIFESPLAPRNDYRATEMIVIVLFARTNSRSRVATRERKRDGRYSAYCCCIYFTCDYLVHPTTRTFVRISGENARARETRTETPLVVPAITRSTRNAIRIGLSIVYPSFARVNDTQRHLAAVRRPWGRHTTPSRGHASPYIAAKATCGVISRRALKLRRVVAFRARREESCERREVQSCCSWPAHWPAIEEKYRWV